MFIHAALGDSTVDPITTEILARNVQASNIEPSMKNVEFLNVSAPDVDVVDGSYLLLAEYEADYNKVSSSYTSTPERTQVHFCFPRIWYFHLSAMIFLEENELVSPCSPCALNSNGDPSPEGSSPGSSARC